MNFKKQRGIASVLVIIGMFLTVFALPVATKLVQQNQENRSSAAGGTTCSSFPKDIGNKTCNGSYVKTCQTTNGSTVQWVQSSSPCEHGCSGGTCKSAPTCTWSTGNWSACTNGTQTRSVTKTPSGCTGTPANKPSTSKSCSIPCTDYIYGSWSACNSNGTQTRSVTGTTPSGCTGSPSSAPYLSQSCTYVPPQVCTPKETKCENNSYKVCKTDGSAWTTTTCSSNQTCNAVNGCVAKPAPTSKPECSSGQMICRNGNVYSCSTANVFIVDKNCNGLGCTESSDTYAFCKTPTPITKQVCTPKEQKCENNIFKTCKTDGSGWSTTTCTSNQNCNAVSGCVAKSPTIICTANTQYKCDGRNLNVCNSDGTGWKLYRECGIDQTCNATTKTCDSKAPAKVCTPGQKVCVNNLGLKECNTSGTDWKLTSCSWGCDYAKNECRPTPAMVCTANTQYKCDGRNLMKCNSTGTAWTLDKECGVDQTCNATTKTCDKKETKICTPEQKTCNSLGVIECGLYGNRWFLIEECGVDQTCNPNTKTCDFNKLPKVDGKCATDLTEAPSSSACLSGAFKYKSESSRIWEWDCEGSNGGLTAHCEELKPDFKCNPGEKKCSQWEAGGVYGMRYGIKECNTAGNGWSIIQYCSYGCENLQCKPPSAPDCRLNYTGAQKCDPITKTITTCKSVKNIDGVFEYIYTSPVVCANGCKQVRAISAECNSDDIKPEIIPVSKITLSNISLNLDIGKPQKLSAIISPTNATNKQVSWSTSDASIVMVYSDGTVKGLKPGGAIITVSAKDGSNTKATIKVNITQSETGIIQENTCSNKKGICQKVTECEADNGSSLGKLDCTGGWDICCITSQVKKVCTDNTQYKCDGRNLMKCNSTGTAWTLDKECGVDQTCNATTKTCDKKETKICTPEQKMCANSLRLKECNTTGTDWKFTSCSWGCDYTKNECKTAPAIVCTADTQYKCDGRNLMKCNSTGTAWDLSLKCTSPEFCNEESKKCLEDCCGSDFRYSGTEPKNLCKPGSVSSNFTYKPYDSSSEGYEEGEWTWDCSGVVNKCNAINCMVTKIKKEKWNKVKVKSITVNPNKKTIMIGESFTIEAHVNLDALNDLLFWNSKDESIATVSDNGVVTGVKKGKTVITVSSVENSKINKKINVTVSGEVTTKTKVESITVEPKKISLKVGDFSNVTTSIKPDSASNKELISSNNNSSVAIIDMNGKIKAIKPGKAIITFTAKDGSKIKNSIEVVVTENILSELSETGETGERNPINIYYIEEGKSVIIKPKLNTNKVVDSISWKSSNTGIVKVYVPDCSDKNINECNNLQYYLEGEAKKCTECKGLKSVEIFGVKKGSADVIVTALPNREKKTIRINVK